MISFFPWHTADMYLLFVSYYQKEETVKETVSSGRAWYKAEAIFLCGCCLVRQDRCQSSAVCVVSFPSNGGGGGGGVMVTIIITSTAIVFPSSLGLALLPSKTGPALWISLQEAMTKVPSDDDTATNWPPGAPLCWQNSSQCRSRRRLTYACLARGWARR